MLIQEAIKIVFESTGLTQREIGKKLGISHVHVCNIQSGHAGFSIELLAKIKEQFGYDPYLLTAVANEEVESFHYQMIIEK